MFLSQNLAAYLGTFIVWGFLMAFLFNLLMGCLMQNLKQNMLLVVISGVMFFSYYTSDHFFKLFPAADYYLTLFFYDLITLLILLVCIKIIKGDTPSSFYVISGLLVNSVLFLSMYLDIYVRGNYDTWFLWKFYSVSVNVIDFMMIFVLITNRDLLGAVRLSRRLKEKSA